MIMKISKLIKTVIIITALTPCFAQDVEFDDDIWVAVASNKYGTNLVFARKDKIVTQSHGWFKITNKNGYDMQLSYANCQTEKTRTPVVITYDKKGNVIDSYENEYEKWETVIPETLGETIQDVICKGPSAIDYYGRSTIYFLWELKDKKQSKKKKR